MKMGVSKSDMWNKRPWFKKKCTTKTLQVMEFAKNPPPNCTWLWVGGGSQVHARLFIARTTKSINVLAFWFSPFWKGGGGRGGAHMGNEGGGARQVRGKGIFYSFMKKIMAQWISASWKFFCWKISTVLSYFMNVQCAFKVPKNDIFWEEKVIPLPEHVFSVIVWNGITACGNSTLK